MLHTVRNVLIRSSRIMLWLTWPGSFFHELAHQLACYAVDHEVLEVRYIIKNDPNVGGFVLHRPRRRTDRHPLPDVVRELIIGIAPLIMGFAVWSVFIGMTEYLTADSSVSVADAVVFLVLIAVTANATYSALPSPLDMGNVFRAPYSHASIACYIIAGPVWLVSHNYRCVVCGWTPWYVLVVVGTIYELYNVVAANLLPALPLLRRLFS